MLDHRILFALIFAALLALSAAPMRSKDGNGSPDIPVVSAVAPIEVEPETRN